MAGEVFIFGAGGSGGSGGFGLQIVEGLVRPKNPTQGMIWAKTERKVTYYDLSATKPENPVEGTLWISISDSGKNKIVSPVSKEWITVYPLSAEQYINGAWVAIDTLSYQDGEWVDWIPDGALYYRGDEMTEKTGGWSGVAWLPNNNYTSDGFTFEKKDTYMSMIFTTVASKGRDCSVYSNNKVDMSKYDTLRIEVDTTKSCRFGLSSTKPSASSAPDWVAYKETSESKTLDVSGYDGTYYIVVWEYCNYSEPGRVDIHEIIAE